MVCWLFMNFVFLPSLYQFWNRELKDTLYFALKRLTPFELGALQSSKKESKAASNSKWQKERQTL